MSTYREVRAIESRRKLDDGAFSLKREWYKGVVFVAQLSGYMRGDMVRMMLKDSMEGRTLHPNFEAWAWSH